MSNGHACCLLSICCPPGSAEQADAFVQEFEHDHPDQKMDRATVEAVGQWVVKNFDVAPAGTLTPFRDAIIKLARK